MPSTYVTSPGRPIELAPSPPCHGRGHDLESFYKVALTALRDIREAQSGFSQGFPCDAVTRAIGLVLDAQGVDRCLFDQD